MYSQSPNSLTYQGRGERIFRKKWLGYDSCYSYTYEFGHFSVPLSPSASPISLPTAPFEQLKPSMIVEYSIHFIWCVEGTPVQVQTEELSPSIWQYLMIVGSWCPVWLEGAIHNREGRNEFCPKKNMTSTWEHTIPQCSQVDSHIWDSMDDAVIRSIRKINLLYL